MQFLVVVEISNETTLNQFERDEKMKLNSKGFVLYFQLVIKPMSNVLLDPPPPHLHLKLHLKYSFNLKIT